MVLDLETTIRNQIKFRGEGAHIIGKPASPFYEGNEICIFAWKIEDQEAELSWEDYPRGHDFIVGQNIKFDLLYLLRDGLIDLSGIKIWDTMVAEHLLSGFRSMFSSLNDLALKYGGEVKDDRVKDYLDAGIDAPDMPKDIIEPYALDDVINTEIVYLAQREAAEALGMLPLIEVEMESLLATTEMEFNGMCFDKTSAIEDSNKLLDKLNEIGERLYTIMAPHFSKEFEESLNVGSATQISKVLFGGEYKFKSPKEVLDEDGWPIRFKTGKRPGEIKTRLEEVVESTEGMKAKADPDWETAREGVFQTNDDVLKIVLKKNKKQEVKEFIELVLEYRKIQKDLSTYYVGYSNLTWPDGMIHPTLHHTTTVTGRQSCASPNLQNVSNKNG